MTGPADSIAEVAEQLGWLGAAVRASGHQSCVSTCSPSVRLRSTAGPDGIPHCLFEFSSEYPTEKAGELEGRCWHHLFRNPVIVNGYPIARRTRYDTGLELPLEMMSALAHSPRINHFLGREYLKEYSTALVPSEKLHDAILWHLYCAADGSRLPYPDIGPAEAATVSLRDLTKQRHILGWCTKANQYAGECLQHRMFFVRPKTMDDLVREGGIG